MTEIYDIYLSLSSYLPPIIISLVHFTTCVPPFQNSPWSSTHIFWTIVVVQLRSHVRLFCDSMDCSIPDFPSLCPRVCSNSCPLNQWCQPTILCSVTPLLLLASIFPSIKIFSSESVLHIRWPNYWSFSLSISPSNEYSGLISFKIDCIDLLPVQRTFKSLLHHHISKASVL